MSVSKNLWPQDIGKSNLKVPRTILIEQANYFNDLTKGVLIANVDSKKMPGQSEGWIAHEFDIVSPAMNNYGFTLLTVYHKITIYPVDIKYHLGEGEYIKEISSDKFEDVIASFFAASRTLDTINGLMAQI